MDVEDVIGSTEMVNIVTVIANNDTVLGRTGTAVGQHSGVGERALAGGADEGPASQRAPGTAEEPDVLELVEHGYERGVALIEEILGADGDVLIGSRVVTGGASGRAT